MVICYSSNGKLIPRFLQSLLLLFFNYHIGPFPGITGEKGRCKGVRYLYSSPTVPKSSVVGAFREGGKERKRKEGRRKKEREEK